MLDCERTTCGHLVVDHDPVTAACNLCDCPYLNLRCGRCGNRRAECSCDRYLVRNRALKEPTAP